MSGAGCSVRNLCAPGSCAFCDEERAAYRAGELAPGAYIGTGRNRSHYPSPTATEGVAS